MSITPTSEHCEKPSLKHLSSRIQLNPQVRTSFDLSNYNSPISSRNNRPTSEVFVRTPQKTQMPEVAAFDKWLEDLQSYENTLEEMESASLDQNFKEELKAIEQWFRVLSEAERTAALYSLLHQTTQVQIRFFITILQQMARNDPMNAFLSPANIDKDSMKNNLSGAINQLNFDRKNGTIMKPLSPSINHSCSTQVQNGSYLDIKTINPMFSNASAALVNQKTRLNANCNSGVFNNTHNQDTIQINNNNSPILVKQDTSASPIWSHSLNKISENTPLGFNRPKSADIGKNQNTQLNSQVVANSASSADYGEFSPFSPGGNWASMVNTPAVPMFSQAPSQNNDLLKGATSKLSSLSPSVQNNDPVILDTDVKKYRRDKNIILSSLTDNNNYTPHPTNTLMYTDHGHIMQMSSQRSISSPLLLRKISPKSESSVPPGFTDTPGWHIPISSQSNGYFAPFDVSSPLLGMEEYISDNSDAIIPNRKGKRVTSKPPENPVNDLLLNDIPAWLRGLRLHKYSDNLGDMNWKDLIEMTDEQLEMKGVAALGARRKLLKSFDQIKEARNLGKF
ncbi:hypothetical protein PCANB_001199 [Pneumocystis canis]|nr:hypothetical protein PCK1_001161 [Pneumocystis canis]KAG5437078.1 hypothetical protein PCANB_001199 [Pneumocystis canis]